MYLQNGSALYRFDAKDVIQGYYRKTPDIYFSGIEFSYSQQNGQHKQIAIPVAGRLPFLQLPATSHSLSISYTALCPEAPDHIMYRYRLVGVDDGWRPITRSETANYNGIGSGEYLFMVQAANASGLWSEPARYTFSIGPDWYERPLAQMLWVMLSIVIILVLAYYVLLMRSQKKELENMLIDQQLKTLRAQINPHFLQNSFEFLAQHIRVGDHEKSINIIHRIARYFRHILYKSDESIVTLEAELESIDEYLSLKKMILHNSFHCSIHIADEVDTIGVMVPCLVLQPLVENAVKYGLDSISHKGHIEIDVQQDEHYVHVSITDSGCRQRVNTPQKEGRQSKGIALTQKRLELLYQRHKHRPSVEMTPLPDRGTKVMVNIPLF
jgi:two-component sensor histidine kinase